MAKLVGLYEMAGGVLLAIRDDRAVGTLPADRSAWRNGPVIPGPVGTTIVHTRQLTGGDVVAVRSDGALGLLDHELSGPSKWIALPAVPGVS